MQNDKNSVAGGRAQQHNEKMPRNDFIFKIKSRK